MWICNIFLPPDNTNQLDFKSLTLKEPIVIGLEISKYSYNWPFSIFQKYLISLLRVHLLGLWQGVEADTEGMVMGTSGDF